MERQEKMFSTSLGDSNVTQPPTRDISTHLTLMRQFTTDANMLWGTCQFHEVTVELGLEVDVRLQFLLGRHVLPLHSLPVEAQFGIIDSVSLTMIKHPSPSLLSAMLDDTFKSQHRPQLQEYSVPQRELF